jgi:hypothetical protein
MHLPVTFVLADEIDQPAGVGFNITLDNCPIHLLNATFAKLL